MAAGRPGLTESRGTVGAGVLQVESGVTLESDEADGVKSRALTAPDALVRFGLTRTVELRTSMDGIVSESIRSDLSRTRSTGYTDLAVGAKLLVLDESRAPIEFSVVPSLSLPTGDAALSSHGFDPAVTLALGRRLLLGFDLTSSASFSSTTRDERRAFDRSASANVGHSVTGAWSAFGEIQAERSGGGPTGWIYDAGVTRSLGDDMQIDFSAGRGLTGGAGDWFVSGGFVIRRVPVRRPR